MTTMIRPANGQQNSVAPPPAVMMPQNLDAPLANLLDADRFGQLQRIAHLMVDFDSRFVAGLEEEPRKVVGRLDAVGIDYRSTFPDLPTHAEQIACWLRGVV